MIPAFALDVHGIEHLFFHLARFQPARKLDQPVGERGFSVVDMRDDGKITEEKKGSFSIGDVVMAAR